MSASTSIIDEYNVNLGYHPSVPPLDIRLGITKSPLVSKKSVLPLRWGILATGKAAHDFTQALKFLSQHLPHNIAAVGSRSMERSKAFATRHNIPNAHGTYEELFDDSTVDIVYIASLHPNHRTHAEMALSKGKHVLVEKPMTMNAEDAAYLYDLGKRLNLFVGEGMWTRFFPAVEWTRMHLGDPSESNGTDVVPIGHVRVVHADFSIDGDDVGPYPSDSLYSKESGGGSAWTVMPYVIGAALMPFGKEPDTIAAAGILPNDDKVGDLALGMTMTFINDNIGGNNNENNSSPPAHKSIASGVVSYLAESSENTMYAAKFGRLTIGAPAHCPTSASLVRKGTGRGNGKTSDAPGSDNNVSCTVIFPLPTITSVIEESGGIRLPNSMGFIYQAEAVRRLIVAGCTTFPQWTPEESIGCIRTIEHILNQIKE